MHEELTYYNQCFYYMERTPRLCVMKTLVVYGLNKFSALEEITV